MHIITKPNYCRSIFFNCSCPVACKISQAHIINPNLFYVFQIIRRRNKCQHQWTGFISFTILLEFYYRRRSYCNCLKIADHLPMWRKPLPCFISKEFLRRFYLPVCRNKKNDCEEKQNFFAHEPLFKRQFKQQQGILTQLSKLFQQFVTGNGCELCDRGIQLGML